MTREPAKKQEGHDGWQNNGQQQEWENPQQHHGKQQLQRIVSGQPKFRNCESGQYYLGGAKFQLKAMLYFYDK